MSASALRDEQADEPVERLLRRRAGAPEAAEPAASLVFDLHHEAIKDTFLGVLGRFY